MLKNLFCKLFAIFRDSRGDSLEGHAMDHTGKINRARQDTAQNQRARMYDAMKKEMAGPIGDRVSYLLIESCMRSPSVIDLPPNVIKYIHEESIKGRRAADIAVRVRSILPGIVSDELVAMCRTIISKASTALNRVRAENLGLCWYVWHTAGDGLVRDSHRIMAGVAVNWREPPSPEFLNGEKNCGNYHAGEGDGCRCWPEPIIDLRDLANKWPMKVYWNGRVQRMKKTQFKTIYQMAGDSCCIIGSLNYRVGRGSHQKAILDPISYKSNVFSPVLDLAKVRRLLCVFIMCH